MYEAPDRYKRMISARLAGRRIARPVAAARRQRRSSPLSDAQLISRAQLAPFFAAANIVAALHARRQPCGAVSPALLLPAGSRAVGARQFRRDAARPDPGDHPCRPLGPQGAAMADGRRSRRPRRRCGCRCRSICSRRSIPAAQVIAASIIAGLGIAALGLVVVPPCVTAWMSGFTAGAQRRPAAWRATASRSSTCCRSCSRLASRSFGVLTVARWAFEPAQDQCRRRLAERKRQPAAAGI